MTNNEKLAKAINKLSLRQIMFRIIVGVLIFITFLFLEHKMNAEYHAGRCAGYGYEADCKTPLIKK